MFNFNMNNNNKKNIFVSDSLDKYYKKAKEDIKRANILFPSMSMATRPSCRLPV